MRKHYDFSNAVRNPHAGKMKDGYTIIIEHKEYDEVITIKKSTKPKGENGTTDTISDAIPVANT